MCFFNNVIQFGWDVEKLITFCNDFQVNGYALGNPTVSAKYFSDLLQKGSSARPSHTCFVEREYFSRLTRRCFFGHAALWKLENGKIICVSMPYGSKDTITSVFTTLATEFSFPESIKLCFLPEKYRYRSNGDFMFMVHDDDFRARGRTSTH